MFVVILVAAVAGSLWLAGVGSWWTLAVPALVALVGVAALLVAGPSPSYGGDVDPLRAYGGALLVAAVPWAAVVGVVTGVSRYRSRP